jgi:hypothetical protein
MKNILLIFFISINCFCQKVEFNKITSEGNFNEYLSKDNKLIKIGDTLNIKFPRTGNTFTFITQGNEPCGVILSNTKNKITKIKVIGNETLGYKAYIIFKGYGLLPVFVEYESAFETGEIQK